MAECDLCGRDENMPYECQRCGGTFCADHRLPEAHDCPGLNQWSGGTGGGHFDSEFDGTIGRSSQSSSKSLVDRLPIDTGPGGIGGYFRNNMAFVFLLLMWLTYGIQLLLRGIGQGGQFGLEGQLFMLRTWALFDVWTWVTSVFAHGSLMHIAFNSLVIYFFGPTVERRLGSKRFTLLFLVGGIGAGVLTALVFTLIGVVSASLGASGAALALLGVLAVLNPDLRVMLLIPPVPMSLNVLVGIVVVISTLFVAIGIPTAFGINHLAHLIGVLIGLAYGKKLKDEGMTAPGQIRMGGGGGPGGGMGGSGRRRF